MAELLDWALYSSAVYTTFPAGWGKLSRATAGQLKGSGLKQGFPDLLIFHNGRCVGIELKVQGRKPSAAQQLMFPRLRQCGVQIYVCQSVDDVIAALREAQVPLRCGWAQSKEKTHEAAGDPSAEVRSAEELT